MITDYNYYTEISSLRKAINDIVASDIESVNAGTNISITGVAGNPVVNVVTAPSFTSLNVTDKPTTRTNLDVYSTTEVNNKLYLAQLQDVDLTVPPITTDVLAYNGTDWIATKGSDVIDITNSLLINVPMDSLITGNTQTMDTSAYGLTGTLNVLNGTNLVAGKLGNGLEFLDVNNQYIQFPYASYLDFKLTDTFTINVWFKSTQSTASQRLICACGQGTNNSGWLLYSRGSTGTISFQLSDNATTRNLTVDYNFGTGIWNNNTWHMLTVCHDNIYGGNTGSEVKLYLDGVLREDVKNIAVSSLLKTDNIQSGQSFYIGSASSGFTSLRQCVLDNLSIFNYNLHDTNIESLYNNNVGKATYTDITTVVDHAHQMTDIIGLTSSLNAKVTGITNTDTNLTITGTTAPIINLNADTNKRIGSYSGFYYKFYTPLIDGNNISANSALVSAVSQMSIGTLPVSRQYQICEYVSTLLSIYKVKMPFKMVMFNYTANTKATISINTYLGFGSGYETYSVSYIPAETTMTSFPANNTEIMVFFTPFNYTLASELTTVTNANYITASNIQTNLGQLDTQLLATTNQLNKNTLASCNFQILRHSANLVPTIGYTANQSLDIAMAEPSNVWDSLICFFLRQPIPVISYNAPKKKLFMVQLYGSLWSSDVDNLNRILMGFTTDSAMAISSNWLTSDFITGFTLAWNVATSSVERAIMGRFSNLNVVQFNYGVSTAGTRIGSTSGQPTVNDVLVFYLDETDYNFTLEWRDSTAGYAVKSTGKLIHPDGSILKGNFNNANIVPIISLYSKYAGYEVRVLSKRDSDLLNITVVDGENIFY